MHSAVWRITSLYNYYNNLLYHLLYVCQAFNQRRGIPQEHATVSFPRMDLLPLLL
jgi:hypothetical protein